jgi:hypothetical protein
MFNVCQEPMLALAAQSKWAYFIQNALDYNIVSLFYERWGKNFANECEIFQPTPPNARNFRALQSKNGVKYLLDDHVWRKIF